MLPLSEYLGVSGCHFIACRRDLYVGTDKLLGSSVLQQLWQEDG